MLTYLPTCLLILFERQNTPISVPDLHHDAQQLLRFGQLIGESTSHLYLSALSFVPEGCPIDRHFSFDLDKRPIICYGRSIHWPSQQASLVGHDDCINCAAFSSDGRRIVSGSSDRTIRLSDAETGALLGEPLRGHDDSINCVTFSSNGKHVVSCWGDRAVRLSDADTGVPVGDPLQGHGDSVASVAFSLDGRRIVSGSSDWHDKSITSIAFEFSPDGRRIVSGSEDRTLRLWDVETGAEVGEQLQGRDDLVTSVAFSRDGRRMVSGSADCTVRLWEFATEVPVGGGIR
ncbi:WD40 repeat-like protein [Stereum hirsutum FP-91666 SS1]|uniref:WD40 repeat-like protein n=1 Tax=Stereum hirsutum (strain FP-91666) TaxID=721885 RepID=UPI000440DC11|nr:WD40 repeat-like protein [Stereum hirsutum FP-91666 SS1]EIM89449.1 WD40 repeat-like protein [Stereum hirsutum FP-91666 SS1]